MPKYIVEYWQLHTAEVDDADNLQQAENSAKDFMREQTRAGTMMRLHTVREVDRTWPDDHTCPDCDDEKTDQIGPWAKGKIFVPPPKEKQ